MCYRMETNKLLNMDKIEYYTPTDNSFAICLETGEKAFPAGVLNSEFNEEDYKLPPIRLKITSHPYSKSVTCFGSVFSYTFVDGLDEGTNLHYSVLYDSKFY